MKSVRHLTEGAILLAAFAIILLMTIYIPVIGLVINFALPLPFIVFAAKNDWKSTSVFVIASFAISLILGSTLALPLTFTYGLTGAVMGTALHKKRNNVTVMISGAFVFLVTSIAVYGISVYFFKTNFIKDIIDIFQKSFSMSAESLKKSGQAKQAELLISRYNLAIQIIKSIVPTFFVIASFLAVLISQSVSYPVLKRFGINIDNYKPFRELKLPRNLLWYFLLFLSANMLFHPEIGTVWSNILLNLTFVLLFLMVFQGYSFILFLLDIKGVPKRTSIILVIVSFILPFSLYIVGILGIMDLGLELRKRFEKKE